MQIPPTRIPVSATVRSRNGLDARLVEVDIGAEVPLPAGAGRDDCVTSVEMTCIDVDDASPVPLTADSVTPFDGVPAVVSSGRVWLTE